mmetsp:Transcript_27698/g.60521  ORF Transcript_27698/g.60521 Transcript_27698/m.60521 type:complete len:460 (-) Transcript_27698:662-2041(-)
MPWRTTTCAAIPPESSSVLVPIAAPWSRTLQLHSSACSLERELRGEERDLAGEPLERRQGALREDPVDEVVREDVLRVEFPAGGVEGVHREALPQAPAQILQLLRRIGQLHLGPVLDRAILPPQALDAQLLVRVEGGGDLGPHRRLLAGEVHDDADPGVEGGGVVGGGGGGAHTGGAAGRPPLLNGGGRGDVLRLDQLQHLLHVRNILHRQILQRATRERHLGDPLLPSALEAEDAVAVVHPHARVVPPERRLRLVHAPHPRGIQGVVGEQLVAQLGKVHQQQLRAAPVEPPLVLRAHLQQQLLHRLALLQLTHTHMRHGLHHGLLILVGTERVAGHHDDVLGVGDPHVADVLVLAKQALVVLLDEAARHHVRALHQLVRRHALDRHLRHHAQAPHGHLREVEELRVGLRRQLQCAPSRGHNLEPHHPLIHRRQRCSGAVGPHLRESAELLLGDGREIL